MRKLYHVIPLAEEDAIVISEAKELVKVFKMEDFEQNLGHIESTFSLDETGFEQMEEDDFIDNFDRHVKCVKLEPIDLEGGANYHFYP